MIDYIYRIWFPNSTCVFDEQHLYDFVTYGEEIDEEGISEIKIHIPIL